MWFQPDSAEYQLLTLPGSELIISLGEPFDAHPQIEIRGNRQGVLSLANALLWLHANDSRREFLSLTELPFVRRIDAIGLVVRVLSSDASEIDCGWVRRIDKGCQFEWELPYDELARLGLHIHRLGCFPEHGYDLFPFTAEYLKRGGVWVRIELFTNRTELKSP